METNDQKVVQKQTANKPDPDNWIHEVSMISHWRKRGPTKHPGSRFLEDVVEGCGQIGVVAWPYGTVCLHHLVATAHLQCTTLTYTNLSTCYNVCNGRQWYTRVDKVNLLSTLFSVSAVPSPRCRFASSTGQQENAAVRLMRRACEHTNLL